MNKVEKQILAKYLQAEALALEELELRARRILSNHPNLKEFVMGMGSASFTLHKPQYFSKDGPLEDMINWYTEVKYAAPVFDFISEWDCILKLTGNPMRFTATGPKITMW